MIGLPLSDRPQAILNPQLRASRVVEPRRQTLLARTCGDGSGLRNVGVESDGDLLDGHTNEWEHRSRTASTAPWNS